MRLLLYVDRLRQGPIEDDAVLTAADFAERLGPEIAFVSDALTLTYRAIRVSNVIEVKASIGGMLACCCSRCGEGIEVPYKASFEQGFMPARAGKVRIEPEDDGLGVMDFDGSTIDLAPLVLEHVILNLPAVPSCADSSRGPCKGWSDAPAAAGDGEDASQEPSALAEALQKIKIPNRH